MNLLEIHDRTIHCVPIKEILVMASMGYLWFQACILPNTSLWVMHVRICTQETLEGKRERETCHQKRIRNSCRIQNILGRVDVKHSWDHPTNVRLLNLRSFLGGDSFCRPCHLIHVYPPTTRPNTHQIHQEQSSIWANKSNLWHQSEEIPRRKWNFCRGRF